MCVFIYIRIRNNCVFCSKVLRNMSKGCSVYNLLIWVVCDTADWEWLTKHQTVERKLCGTAFVIVGIKQSYRVLIYDKDTRKAVVALWVRKLQYCSRHMERPIPLCIECGITWKPDVTTINLTITDSMVQEASKYAKNGNTHMSCLETGLYLVDM